MQHDPLNRRRFLQSIGGASAASLGYSVLVRADDLAAFTQRVMSELVRDRVPVSQIHPEVDRHMQPIRRP